MDQHVERCKSGYYLEQARLKQERLNKLKEELADKRRIAKEEHLERIKEMQQRRAAALALAKEEAAKAKRERCNNEDEDALMRDEYEEREQKKESNAKGSKGTKKKMKKEK